MRFRERPNGLTYWRESRFDTVQTLDWCRVAGTEGEPIFWLNAAAALRSAGDKIGSRACIRRARDVRAELENFDEEVIAALALATNRED